MTEWVFWGEVIKFQKQKCLNNANNCLQYENNNKARYLEDIKVIL